MKMDENYIKKISTALVLIALIVLSFFLLRPILLSVIMGIMLAFIFAPVYNRLYKLVKSKNLSAIIICVLLLVLVVMPFYFLIPIFVDQSVKLYSASQQIDFITPIKNIFPSIIPTDKFSEEIGSMFSTFVTKITNSLIAYLSQLILNIPSMLLQLVVVLFTFYFILMDKKQFFSYVQSLMPFSKEIEKKIIDQTKKITVSVVYGQVIIGLIQGAIAGLGLFIFKVPNSLLLTVIACVAGIFPIIGTAVVWIPVAIFLIIEGNPLAALGVSIFGIISSVADNFLRPIIVARRSKIHPAILLVGMIGGLYMFGILGFILGPLILAYLLILLEVYRDKKVKGILIQPETR
ncbi:AI-2E family transporter [Candidatus Pacearchaeota archaeon]|nr:AI-2E family transporter [Candidatus Pacearchaeota archaeon]